MKRFCAGVLVFGFFLGIFSLSSEEVIRFEKGNDSYEYAVLDLILKKTVGSGGPFRLNSLNLKISEDRAIDQLRDDKIDVTFMVLTREREKQVLPVRVDLDRGIQGLRVFLVLRQNLDRFSMVQDLETLRTQFTFGFGAQWGDLGVLHQAGFRVVTSADGQRLYAMLQAGRFDCFPRGINEVWDNLKQHQTEAPDMVVEPHLALFYPLVVCFVVAPGNTKLADRLSQGLGLALADGSLKKLFWRFYGEDIVRSQLGARKILNLSNPDLPVQGPTIDTSWWSPSLP